MPSNETGVGPSMTGARSGYDDGYSVCPCFWGRAPGSLVRRFIDTQTVKGLRILDPSGRACTMSRPAGWPLLSSRGCMSWPASLGKWL
jgi:hypothetical protein